MSSIREIKDGVAARLLEALGVSTKGGVVFEGEINLKDPKVQEAIKNSGMEFEEVAPGMLTLKGNGLQTKAFLESLGDRELAKRLISMADEKASMVDNPTEGELLATLDMADMEGFAIIDKHGEELRAMMKDAAMLEAKINAKRMVFEGMSTLWWESIGAKYPKTAESRYNHIDKANTCIRAGMLKRE